MNAIKLTDILGQMGLSIGKGSAAPSTNVTSTTTPSTASQPSPSSAVEIARPSAVVVQGQTRGTEPSTAAPVVAPSRPVTNAPQAVRLNSAVQESNRNAN